MKKTYVTFHFPNGIYTYAKWAIEVKENEDLSEIVSDVNSLDGVKYLNINKSGRLQKGYQVISYNNGEYLANI